MNPPFGDAVVLDLNALLTSWSFYAVVAAAYLVFRLGGGGGTSVGDVGDGDRSG